MNWFSGLVIFQSIWWVVFFMILPIQHETETSVSPGCSTGAPKNAKMKLKLILTTALSIVFFGLFLWIKTQGWLSFEGYAQ